MSRREKTPTREARPARKPGAPIARVSAWLAATVAVAVLGVAFAFFWRGRGTRDGAAAGPSLPVEGLTATQMLDSVRTHFEAHQWDRALAWAHASNVAEPGDARLLLNEALAWHNYAQDATQRWPGRSATRTSLDRIEFEKHAFALLDSAEAVARTDEEWANVRRWRGTQYEVLGSPLDAVQAYEEALARSPGHRATIERFGWIQRLIVRPSDPKSVTAQDAAPRPR
ncbi:MAG: hypothetical protein HZA61_01410 [Candidatus Eisenbacteria bacterium]|uniref:Tetratricopeptide repeat protein n=1 Tax=Eiseniibacteriota bacterium TaxID=2212470 RepID=A0A933S9E5_UNCEI|nr:hypothetical protein [Candidatus Eisenbacteria bacterium]